MVALFKPCILDVVLTGLRDQAHFCPGALAFAISFAWNILTKLPPHYLWPAQMPSPLITEPVKAATPHHSLPQYPTWSVALVSSCRPLLLKGGIFVCPPHCHVTAVPSPKLELGNLLNDWISYSCLKQKLLICGARVSNHPLLLLLL